MIKKLMFLSLFLGLLMSCKDKGVGTPPPTKPACNWQNKDDISYRYIELNHPSNANNLVHYKNIYMSDKIRYLTGVFGSSFEQKKSQIKVTTSASACISTTSKSKTFTSSNHAGITNTAISDIPTPTNSNGEFKVMVEIKSGLHSDFSGGSGYVIWTKSVNANVLDSPQSGKFNGVYKKTSSTSSSSSTGGRSGLQKPIDIRLYEDGEYKSRLLPLR